MEKIMNDYENMGKCDCGAPIGYSPCICATPDTPSSTVRNFTPLENINDVLKSFDARVWAQQFCLIADELGYKKANGDGIDEGWMITWFASALMRGHDEHRWKEEEKRKLEYQEDLAYFHQKLFRGLRIPSEIFEKIYGGIAPKEITLFDAGTDVGRSSITEFTTVDQPQNVPYEQSTPWYAPAGIQHGLTFLGATEPYDYDVTVEEAAETICQDIKQLEEENIKIDWNSMTIENHRVLHQKIAASEDINATVTMKIKYGKDI